MLCLIEDLLHIHISSFVYIVHISKLIQRAITNDDARREFCVQYQQRLIKLLQNLARLTGLLRGFSHGAPTQNSLK